MQTEQATVNLQHDNPLQTSQMVHWDGRAFAQKSNAINTPIPMDKYKDIVCPQIMPSNCTIYCRLLLLIQRFWSRRKSTQYSQHSDSNGHQYNHWQRRSRWEPVHGINRFIDMVRYWGSSSCSSHFSVCRIHRVEPPRCVQIVIASLSEISIARPEITEFIDDLKVSVRTHIVHQPEIQFSWNFKKIKCTKCPISAILCRFVLFKVNMDYLRSLFYGQKMQKNLQSKCNGKCIAYTLCTKPRCDIDIGT